MKMIRMKSASVSVRPRRRVIPAACQVIVGQAGDQRHAIRAHRTKVRQQVGRRAISQRGHVPPVVFIHAEIRRRPGTASRDVRDQPLMPAFGADQVRQHVPNRPRLSFAVDRPLPRLERQGSQAPRQRLPLIAQFAYQEIDLLSHFAPLVASTPVFRSRITHHASRITFTESSVPAVPPTCAPLRHTIAPCTAPAPGWQTRGSAM